MCGFAGVLKTRPVTTEDKETVKAMGRLLAHRGPDSSGHYADGPYAVAHQRLKIIDLTDNGSQPMQNIEGNISIAYNGEVYNFKELKSQYCLDKKFKFKSTTDTEVLLYLYELLGIDFIHKLNGMFSMAIWDSKKGRLYLARDRFGIKPLFYAVTRNALWFSSEIKSLLRIPGFDRKVNLEAMHHFFSFDYIPGAGTAFDGILEVRPGSFLEISAGKAISVTKHVYWKPKYGDIVPDDPARLIDDIRQLLEKSVKYRLISDVPVGVMLSGGIDSSALTALMSKIRNNSDFHTFSIGFDDDSFDESKYAEVMALHVGTTHHSIRITPQSIIDNIEKHLLFIDEPYADGSAIPTYLLSQEAKKFVTVLLSGEGGDETFSGYETYLAYFARQYYRKLPFVFRKWLTMGADKIPVSYKKLAFSFKMKRFVGGAESSVPLSHYKWREVFSEEEKKHLFNSDALKYLQKTCKPSYELFREKFSLLESPDEFNKLLGIDCSYHLPDDLMIKNDRMTMAHSLEARVPFTDLELFEYVARLAGRVKMHRFQLKYLLKQAMSALLPKSILRKKKVGLEIPYSQWFCSELKELLLDNLSPSSIKNIPFINASYVQRIISEHLAKKRDRGRELWGLLNFSLWYRLYFIDNIY